MATENPKVVGYVPIELAEKLENFKTERGLKSVSQALTMILSEYFDSESGTPVDHQLSNRVEVLERKVASLTRQISQGTQEKKSTSRPLVEHSKKNQSASVPLVEHLEGGISQRELCERFEISSKSVARIAQRSGMNVHQYLEQVTGWQYRVRLGQAIGKFYPPAKPK